jgi:hypothetical protein
MLGRGVNDSHTGVGVLVLECHITLRAYFPRNDESSFAKLLNSFTIFDWVDRLLRVNAANARANAKNRMVRTTIVKANCEGSIGFSF